MTGEPVHSTSKERMTLDMISCTAGYIPQLSIIEKQSEHYALFSATVSSAITQHYLYCCVMVGFLVILYCDKVQTPMNCMLCIVYLGFPEFTSTVEESVSYLTMK